MNSVTVNGKTLKIGVGRSIAIRNGEIYIDGELHQPDAPKGEAEGSLPSIHVEVHGSLESLAIEGNNVAGDVKAVVKGSVGKSVEVRQGRVSVGGDVNGPVDLRQGRVDVAGNVAGNVDVNQGNVTAGFVAGNVRIKMGNCARG